ncbi:hypothetical protein K469DRAFT_688245 [Zopfia rhizophila CBS 207.26]|uniref:DH domain-containing protein n=1 Tax=Zopfia rhizophila CBS 207.26 TaxID=1314779 RepID=A0A6A6E581_9PEZI|nr:hypothetical protein K469DRAFT_688245 [Zopfia rhizophila CBS 207.26]
MGEPENKMHNYAFAPSVANWVHSTSLAQLDGSTDEPSDHDPDDFYRPPLHRPDESESLSYSNDMTTSRQRQQTTNGAVRSTPKPAFRSASGPATSSLSATRSTPHLPGDRPTVKSLAQKFNQTPPTDSASAVSRVHGASRPALSSRSTTSPPAQPTSSSSSPARPTKEASYGSYKFNNLKPRDRPQAAPASPATIRRTKGSRTNLEQTSPSRTKPSSPARSHKQQAGSVRQPFFGEVIGDHQGAIAPGYGIPNYESARRDSDPTVSPTADNSTIMSNDSHLAPPALFSGASPVRHRRSPSTMTESSAGGSQPANAVESSRLREQRRNSPPSRIPVATRRRSTASDSSSSSRSLKTGASLTYGGYNKNSPVRPNRTLGGKENNIRGQSKTAAQTTLPAVSYRQYREHGKTPKGASNSKSLTAVITAPPQQMSPRLRNSRERQLLPQGSPDLRSRSADRHAGTIHEDNMDESRAYTDLGVTHPGETDEHSAFQIVPDDKTRLLDQMEAVVSKVTETSVDNPTAGSPNPGQLAHEQGLALSTDNHPPLLLQTSSLQVPQVPEPLSSTTDFEYEESPVLGMPGSFMMTPPIAQKTPPLESAKIEEHRPPPESTSVPEVELLQACTFSPPSKGPTQETSISADIPQNTTSEFGIRESIPIMLGSDEPPLGWATSAARSRQSPRVNIGAHKWRAQPLDASGTISYLDDDSPIDPFANRETLRPDDSASVAAFYRNPDRRSPEWTPRIPAVAEDGRLTLDSEAYSVINKVLNLYHQSSIVTPEMAFDFQQQVQSVSPVIAQHKDWDSKEATETYLARLLSDANVSTERDSEQPVSAPREDAHHRLPSVSVDELDDSEVPEAGGTAIIFPSESRRYSRGSRGSSTTTIWEDGSRADSSSAHQARDQSGELDDFAAPYDNHQPAYPPNPPPNPPPKDWRYSPSQELSYPTGDHPRRSNERLGQPFNSLLPEIESAGEGLGLSLQASQQARREQHDPPPPPSYSPPPPPAPPSIDQATGPLQAPYTPSVYGQQPPSSIFPSAPLPSQQADMCLPVVHHRRRGGGYATIPDQVPDSDVLDSGGGFPSATASSTAVDSNMDGLAMNESVLQRSDLTETTRTTSIDEPPLDEAILLLRRRYNVVKELVETEHGFACDMMVVDQIFQQTSDSVMTERERRTLFSNSHDVQKFANSLYRALKKSAKPIVNPLPPPKAPSASQEIGAKNHESDDVSTEASTSTETLAKEPTPDEQNGPPVEPYNEYGMVTAEHDRETNIGAVMNENMAKLERVFTTYLLNHEDANQFLKVAIKRENILGWQMACIKGSEGLTKAWDLDSLLVKPTQRLMKYPLLLEELEKVTPQEHPDFAAIKAARQELIQISVRINQAKTRQETLREATKEGKKEKKSGFLENRLGKNFVKALTSKTDKVKQGAGVGVSEIFDDKDYNFLAQRFGGHFFQLQIVLRDVEKYLEDVTNFMITTNCLIVGFIGMLDNGPSSSPEIESTWRRQAMALFELQNVALEDHKNAVRLRILKPILELWSLHGRPQKLMDQRKKGLQQYAKYKQALERKEKIDSKLQDAADQFETVNNALKAELPLLYSKTKKCVIACLQSFILYQKEWWKNCQKKILPLLEYEPEHTTSMPHDLRAYVDRFHSDSATVNTTVNRLAIINHSLLADVANFMSPVPTLYSDDTSSRKSSSRRTESISSDMSYPEGRQRRSGGYSIHREDPYINPRAAMPSFEGPPRASPQARYFTPTTAPTLASRAISPSSDRSDITVTQRTHSSPSPFSNLDGAFDSYNTRMESAFLSPTSYPGSSRTSGVFNSALPMSDSPTQTRADEPSPSIDQDEPEVLFLAASLFEFNIAHDRKEGGIPYLVYVPGEIFDVIGMKGELWLARNQDDASRTVGWIWEKHFARILPEDA